MLMRRSDRDDREGRQRGDQRDARRQRVQQPVGHRRPHVFFEEQLQARRRPAAAARWSDPVGADAHLHAADDAAFEPGHVRHAGQQGDDDDQRADDVDDDLKHGRRATPGAARRPATGTASAISERIIVQAVGRRTGPEPLRQAGDDAPVGSRVRRRRAPPSWCWTRPSRLVMVAWRS